MHQHPAQDVTLEHQRRDQGFATLQDAEPQVLEPDKCVGWEWAPWQSIPQPVFMPLQLLLNSAYDPFKGAQ